MNLSKHSILIKEAIILAGGLGTRLKEVVPDLPKSMAMVAGQPFLTYIIRHLLSQRIERFIFSLGYKHEWIEAFLKTHYSYLDYQTIVEHQPLGTGGAIRFALSISTHRDVLIVNGDTLFKINVESLAELHIERQADCTLTLKPMEQFDRYGMVEIDSDSRITRFTEKKYVARGNINGGVYLLNKVSFLKKSFPAVFSFEKDYLSKQVESQLFYGLVQNKYFVDIGIPEDLERAQQELIYPSLRLEEVDQAWTLWLDRDGVINVNKEDSYVFHRGEFEFLEGATEALARLRPFFGRMIIVTNQRGIGKGLMDENALADIHQHMIEHIEAAGGSVDALYYCAIDDEKHHDRKPNPGMPLEAAKMFPEIDFSKSIMIGDKLSDMELGRNIGAFTVLVTSNRDEDFSRHPDVDLSVVSLAAFKEKLIVSQHN